MKKTFIQKSVSKHPEVSFLVVYCTIALILFLVSRNANALELLDYKSNTNTVKVVPRANLDAVWSSNTPSCIKEGAKLIGVNKAFKANKLGYRDCSSSVKRARIHDAMGIKVKVFKLSELDTPTIKEIKNMTTPTANIPQ